MTMNEEDQCIGKVTFSKVLLNIMNIIIFLEFFIFWRQHSNLKGNICKYPKWVCPKDSRNLILLKSHLKKNQFDFCEEF